MQVFASYAEMRREVGQLFQEGKMAKAIDFILEA